MKFITILLLLIINSTAFSISLEEVIKKHKTYIGAEKLEGITDFKIIGKLLNDKKPELAVENNVEYYFLKPDYHRLHAKMGVTAKNHITFDGKSGWMKQPGMPPMPLDGRSQYTFMVISSAVISPLVNYKEKGYKLTLQGEEKITGIPCYKLVMQDTAGILTDFFVAKDNFRIVKFLVIKSVYEQPLLIETYYDSYKDFGGVKIPSKLESFIGGNVFKLEVDTIDYNIGLNSYDFRKPD